MNSWCESCARKNLCYVVDDRPKCFVPITNTASGTPESYLAKALRFSRDSHEIAKTENSSEKPNNCEDLQDWKDRMWAEAIVTEPTISKMEQVDEPQTEDDKKHCVFCKWVYEPNVCGRCRNMNLFADAIEDEPQTERSE